MESIRKARLQNTAEKQQSAQVDSFLYYQPVALKDPFLDSLTVQNDRQQTLKIRLVPPPKPLPSQFKQVEGYRVQTFAGIDSLNALVMANDLQARQQDSVYFFKEEALFKIQIGDYLYRNDADMKVLDLRKLDVQGAWVVQRMVNIPRTSDSAADSLQVTDTTDYPYTIQVLVTADENKAKMIVSDLKMRFETESNYIQADNLYKVFLGKFVSREEAQKMLEKVRQNGYQDAWLVYEK